MSQKRLVVLVSGSGTTLDNLCLARKDGRLNAHMESVISDRNKIGACDVAKKHGLIFCSVPRMGGGSDNPFDGYGSTEKWSEAIYNWAEFSQPDLIILAGFKKQLHIPRKYEGRILNIHPSLLPAYGGKGMYGLRVHQAVIDAGEKWTGCTVHIVDNEYDHGLILAQARVPVLPGDTAETLQQRVQEAEKNLYPLVIEHYCVEGLRPILTTMRIGQYLPEHWKEWVTTRRGGKLVASDFKGVVALRFEDGSSAMFQYAFYVEDRVRNELAVFTEHCGYHIFHLAGLQYSYLEHARNPFQSGEEV